MRFVQAIQLYGKNDYLKLQEHIGTRTGKQIRSHQQKYFRKVSNVFGDVPDADQLAKIEGICSSNAQSEMEVYFSDTGAKVTDMCKERDAIAMQIKGRPNRFEKEKLEEFDFKVKHKIE